MTGMFLFFAAIFVAGSFPLQVLAGTPMPSLLPYVFLTGAASLRLLQGRGMHKPAGHAFSRIDSIVLIYVLLISGHMLFHAVDAEVVNINGLMANAANFLLPVGFYLYFRYFGLREVRGLMSGVFVAGLVFGGLSAFHAYTKLERYGSPVIDSYIGTYPPEVLSGDALHEKPQQCPSRNLGAQEIGLYDRIEQFQWKAAEYSRVRSGADSSYLCKSLRGSPIRSAGLLENHAVTAVWMGFGMLAALMVIPCTYIYVRIALILCFGSFVLAFQYYTGLLAYSLVTLLLFVRYLYRSEFSWRSIRRGFIYFAVALVVLTFVLISKTEIVVGLSALFEERLEMLMDGVWLSLFIAKYLDWVAWAQRFPAGILIGDGFGIYFPYSFNKGGDIGLIESLAKLGLPLFAFIVYCGLSWIRGYWFFMKEAMMSNEEDGLYFLFMIALAIINEIHYSVWTSKAVLPLLFASIAILSSLPRNRRVAVVGLG